MEYSLSLSLTHTQTHTHRGAAQFLNRGLFPEKPLADGRASKRKTYAGIDMVLMANPEKTKSQIWSR